MTEVPVWVAVPVIVTVLQLAGGIIYWVLDLIAPHLPTRF